MENQNQTNKESLVQLEGIPSVTLPPHERLKWAAERLLLAAFSTDPLIEKECITPYLELAQISSSTEIPARIGRRFHNNFEAVLQGIATFEKYAQETQEKLDQAVRLTLFLEHLYIRTSIKPPKGKWGTYYTRTLKEEGFTPVQIKNAMKETKELRFERFKKHKITSGELSREIQKGFRVIFGQAPSEGQLNFLVLKPEERKRLRGYKDAARIKAGKMANVAHMRIHELLSKLSDEYRHLLLRSVLRGDEGFTSEVHDKTWPLRFVAKRFLKLPPAACFKIEAIAVKHLKHRAKQVPERLSYRFSRSG